MAKETLTVKNFGPIREAHLDLRKVTVLIGEQASGKSVLAKLISCFNDFKDLEEELLFWEFKNMNFPKFLCDYISEWNFPVYGIDSLLNADTVLTYQSKLYNGVVKKDSSSINIANEIMERIKEQIEKFNDKLSTMPESYSNLSDGENLFTQDEAFLRNTMTEAKNKIVEFIGNLIYVPAERVVESIDFQEYRENHYIRNFSEYLSLAKESLSGKEFKIIGIKYIGENKSAPIIIEKNGQKNVLPSASSGIQSALPMMLLIEYCDKLPKCIFVIEEPELSLYPTTQKKLVEYLIEKCTKGDNRLIITTHSPYILTALNNCIQARNTLREHPEHADEVAKLVRPESQIDFEDVMAYFVADGTAKPIMNNENRLIDANALDDVSNELGEIFDRLLDLEMQPA